MQRSDAPAFQLHGLFETPVVSSELPDAARLNPALAATIRERAREHPSTHHSNLGGWQSSWDFAEWGGAAGAALLDHTRSIADRLTADRDGAAVTVTWHTNAWANINAKGHGNEFHTHPGCFWSGVYYVEDGGIGANPELGGELEIQDPRGVAPAMYAPKLCFAVPHGPAMGATETMSPRAGVTIMFPSWLSHAVRPYLGEAERISIAFNLSVNEESRSK